MTSQEGFNPLDPRSKEALQAPVKGLCSTTSGLAPVFPSSQSCQGLPGLASRTPDEQMDGL